jgi:hypothetical protein
VLCSLVSDCSSRDISRPLSRLWRMMLAQVVLGGCLASSLTCSARGETAPGCVSAVGPAATVRSMNVTIPQQGGGTLSAKVFAPEESLQTAPCPCLTMLPGGGAAISSVEWAAVEMARNGYVVVVTLPASAGSTAAYNTAARSGIDFLLSAANPYRAGSDVSRIGAAGWSLGARALSRTQEEDTRLSAIVAWDNLAVSESGDAGSPSCSNVPGTIRIPRVPAMGQASDSCSNGIESKKTAFLHWRNAGVPAYQVVFAGSTHFWWSGSGTQQQRAICNYYTLAWFDRWLKGDLTAAERLLSRSPAGASLQSLLSANFRSAAFFDGIDCADLRTGESPAIAVQPVSVTGCPREIAAMSVSLGGTGVFAFQWQWQPAGAGGQWVNLLPGNNAGPGGETVINVIDATSATLSVRPLAGYSAVSPLQFRCIITGPCGRVASSPAGLAIVACGCSSADIAGGGDAGRDPDGTVDGADFIAFINSFAIGDAAVDPAADIAGGGSGGLAPDGTIDGTDFIEFINAFAIGC